jgi:hypothetical protein
MHESCISLMKLSILRAALGPQTATIWPVIDAGLWHDGRRILDQSHMHLNGSISRDELATARC